MRFIALLGLIVILVMSCGGYSNTNTQNKDTAISKSDTLRIANDSIGYEILIIEPGFYNWLVTQFPEEYYQQSFLRNRNIFWSAEYNRRVINSLNYNTDFYLQQIEYQPTVDYGKEVDYLLYNWFVYFQEKFDQKL